MVSNERWHSLTDAERVVAALVAQGHTNRQVARALGRSTNTIGTHLRSIFAKMQVQSRVQLANAVSDVERRSSGTSPAN